MRTSIARRLVLGLIVCGAVAAAPTAASAATTYATIHSECWLREYPPDSTCDQGWIGTSAIGQSTLGESISLFGANFNLPSGATVNEATLRFETSANVYDNVYIGDAYNLDWSTDTWWTWDTSNIDVFTDFVPGAWGVQEVDFTDYVTNNPSGGFFGMYADPSSSPAYVEDFEIEIDYDL